MKRLLLFITILSLGFGLAACNDGGEDGRTPDDQIDLIELTLEELAAYDGLEGRDAYIAVDGKIYDVTDDPRIQYPEEAKKEGIASILSVPIIIGDNLIGCLRVYTAQPWEFTLNDVNFVQAVAQIVGMALEMCRINKGLKDSIDILKTMRDPRSYKSTRRTPYEGVPTSVSADEMPQTST